MAIFADTTRGKKKKEEQLSERTYKGREMTNRRPKEGEEGGREKEKGRRKSINDKEYLIDTPSFEERKGRYGLGQVILRNRNQERGGGNRISSARRGGKTLTLYFPH